MAFGIGTHNLPSRREFTSYAKAKAYHDSIKPKRGTNDRPLCANRRGPYWIRIANNGDVELVYYSTAVVTITTRDTVKLDLSYQSHSTNLFADALTPIYVGAHRGQPCIYAEQKCYIGDTFEYDLKEQKLLSGQTDVYVRRVNRQRAKPAQKLLKKMEAFHEMMCAMDPEYKRSVGLQRMGSSPVERQHVLTAVPDESSTWYQQVYRKLIYQHLQWDNRKDKLYTAIDAYDWVKLDDGTLPPKGAAFRVEVRK